MYNLINDLITYCVWICDRGKVNASDKIMFETQKKRRYGNKRYFLHFKPTVISW